MKEMLKKGFSFNKQEINALVLTILVFSFIFTFNQWGPGEKAEISVGLKNFLINSLIIGFSLIIHHLTQKFAAIKKGYKAEQKLWLYGLVIGLLAAFLTNGRILFFAASGLFISRTKYRIGYKRQEIDIYDYGKIAMWGIMSNIFLGATLLTWSWILGMTGEMFHRLFLFNLLFAFYNLLPILPLDGSRMFFASRINYVYIMSSYTIYLALILLLGVYSFIWAALVAYIILLLYYYYIETGM